MASLAAEQAPPPHLLEDQSWQEPPLPTVQLVETDGEKLDSPWHRAQIDLFIAVLTWLWRQRTDYYVGGNMFLYYSEQQARDRDYRGPDFFYVRGVDRERPRLWWAIWQENGRYPDFITELMSPSTANVDRTTKKDIYERIFRTPEYFLYDPRTGKWEGWRLNAQPRYEAVQPDERGWMWSEVLQLWLGPWQGEFEGIKATWQRFYDRDRQLILLESEDERLQKEAELKRAETEVQRAESERQRADVAERRAAELADEISRLNARLAELEKGT